MYGPCIYAAVGLDGALLLLGPAALLLLLGRSQHLTQHALEVLPGTQRGPHTHGTQLDFKHSLTLALRLQIFDAARTS